MYPFCTRVELYIKYDRPTLGRLYCVVAAVFGFGTYGTGEVGENHIEKGLGFFYWCWTFMGFIGPTGAAMVLVWGHGFLRTSAIMV